MNKRLVLIGWSGSKPKYIQKYIEHYNRLGFNDIKYYCPSLFEPIQATGLLNAKNLRSMYTDNTYIHCFSGGYYLYLMSLLRNQNSYNYVPHKLIIDSAPISPDGESCARFAKVFVPNIPHKLISSGLPLVWNLQSKYYRKDVKYTENYLKLDGNFLLNELQHRIDCTTSHPKSTLCLYSDNDPVINNAYIEETIKKHNWNFHKFHTGKHSQLLIEPNYWNIIDSFLSK